MAEPIEVELKIVRRIEIITPSVELRKVLELLDSLHVKGYSILRNVSGKGDRGTTACDIDLDGACNDYVLAVCDDEQEKQVMKAMRPILQRYGGVCLSSEAKWLLHSGPNW
jgi:nitrogen regulatory protein PII